MTMLDDSPRRIGESITASVCFDPSDRGIKPHPKLLAMLASNPAAKKVFDDLAPSRRHEIVRYIDNLKTDESVDRNVGRALDFLLGRGRFVGRDRHEPNDAGARARSLVPGGVRVGRRADPGKAAPAGTGCETSLSSPTSDVVCGDRSPSRRRDQQRSPARPTTDQPRRSALGAGRVSGAWSVVVPGAVQAAPM